MITDVEDPLHWVLLKLILSVIEFLSTLGFHRLTVAYQQLHFCFFVEFKLEIFKCLIFGFLLMVLHSQLKVFEFSFILILYRFPKHNQKQVFVLHGVKIPQSRWCFRLKLSFIENSPCILWRCYACRPCWLCQLLLLFVVSLVFGPSIWKLVALLWSLCCAHGSAVIEESRFVPFAWWYRW